MKAFPSKNAPYYINEDGASAHQSGMDLRDYFAAKAMQAIIGKSDDASINVVEIDNWIGHYSYTVADAMMEARKK